MPGTVRTSTARGRHVVTLLDQAASSGSNFALMILVARGSSTADFGAFTIIFGVVAFALSISRASLGVPLSTDLAGADEQRRRELTSHSTAAALAIGALTGLVVATLTIAVELADPIRTVILLFALACPVIVVQDVWRFGCVADDRAGRALLSDTAWMVVAVAAVGYNLLAGDTLSARTAALVWIAGGVLALLVLLPSRTSARPHFGGFVGAVLLEGRRAHLSSDAVLAAVAPMVVALGVAGLASADVLGAMRGASTLMSPVNVTIAALQLGAVAEASRRTPLEATHLMQRLTGALVLASMVWGGLLMLVPAGLGRGLLGPTWAPAHAALPFITLEYVGLATWIGAVSLLRVRRRTAQALRLRVGYAAASIVLGLAVAATVGTPEAVILSLGVVALVMAAVAWRALHRRPVLTPDLAPAHG